MGPAEAAIVLYAVTANPAWQGPTQALFSDNLIQERMRQQIQSMQITLHILEVLRIWLAHSRAFLVF